MLNAIFINPSLFGVIALAFFARLIDEFSRRSISMGPAAGAGIGMFIASSILMNAYMIYPNEDQYLPQQLFLWRYGLLTDVVLYAAVYLLVFKGKSFGVLASLLFAAGLHIIVISDFSISTKQVAEFLQISLIAGYAWACFRRVQGADLIGILFWGVLAVNEVMSAAWVGNCQYIKLGIREAGGACTQIYGFGLAQVCFYISILLCSWFLFRWFWPRTR